MNFLLAAVFIFFVYRRLLTYLHIYQQDEYDEGRFVRWLFESRSFDRRVSAGLLVLGVIELLAASSAPTLAAAAVLGLIAAAVFERDPRKVSKKPLRLTQRATRLLAIALVLMSGLAILYAVSPLPLLAWIVLVQAIPFALPGANLLLRPYERTVQRRFADEAHQKLLSLRPTVVGITGSFGKTTVKHLLAHILETQAPTLMTPGSVNTPMGVSRIIREQLGPHHRFFVCEMGAYGPGSITRLCGLAPPNFGAITAIGMAHYERFKSLETVAQAKFELGEAVASNHGVLVVQRPVMDFGRAQAFARDSSAVLRVVEISRSGQDAGGVFAEVVWRGTTYSLRARLYGEHHAANIAIAFTLACEIGIDPEQAQRALQTAAQITHRLEVKTGLAGSVLIDDAYNSNPAGFISGLRLLNTLRKPGGRRILVTPGMVELGVRHDEEHRNVARVASETVDVLLPVLARRITAFVDTFRALAPGAAVIPCERFEQAQQWMLANVTSSDVVLLENDLPDLYERKLRL